MNLAGYETLKVDQQVAVIACVYDHNMWLKNSMKRLIDARLNELQISEILEIPVTEVAEFEQYVLGYL